jgi:hypothetical protein
MAITDIAAYTRLTASDSTVSRVDDFTAPFHRS